MAASHTNYLRWSTAKCKSQQICSHIRSESQRIAIHNRNVSTLQVNYREWQFTISIFPHLKWTTENAIQFFLFKMKHRQEGKASGTASGTEELSGTRRKKLEKRKKVINKFTWRLRLHTRAGSKNIQKLEGDRRSFQKKSWTVETTKNFFRR